MFTSHRPHALSTFVRASTAFGANVTATAGHYIYARKGNAAVVHVPHLAGWELTPAIELRVGDELMVADASGSLRPSPITALEAVEEVGLFNPHTRAGAIVVDGVAASELTAFVPRWAAGRPALHRVVAAALRLAFALLPRGADSRIASVLSGAVHGAPDALVDRQAFLLGAVSAPAAAAAA